MGPPLGEGWGCNPNACLATRSRARSNFVSEVQRRCGVWRRGGKRAVFARARGDGFASVVASPFGPAF
eukprot:7108928-Lingulodinium_polyedra.AAC.1